jgi:hypothetical protein
MNDKVIRQNAGFIAAESKRAQEHLQRSRELRAAGNERGSKALQTRAMNEMARVEKAATTIKQRSKDAEKKSE